MGEEIRHHSTRVRRRRRHKSSVTNINIFAMTSSPEVVAQPALPVPAAAPAPSVEHEDDDLFGERMVSTEWIERRAKRADDRRNFAFAAHNPVPDHYRIVFPNHLAKVSRRGEMMMQAAVRHEEHLAA